MHTLTSSTGHHKGTIYKEAPPVYCEDYLLSQELEKADVDIRGLIMGNDADTNLLRQDSSGSSNDEDEDDEE